MKTVAFLFLFTLSAQGQGKTTDSSVTYSSKRISLLNKFDLGIAVRYDTTAIVEVVTSLWRDYKAECWADSSFRAGVWMPANGGSRWYEVRESEWMRTLHTEWIWERRWTHRDPTLTDFMDWLERRTK